jgi:hypothetical protein
MRMEIYREEKILKRNFYLKKFIYFKQISHEGGKKLSEKKNDEHV